MKSSIILLLPVVICVSLCSTQGTEAQSNAYSQSTSQSNSWSSAGLTPPQGSSQSYPPLSLPSTNWGSNSLTTQYQNAASAISTASSVESSVLDSANRLGTGLESNGSGFSSVSKLTGLGNSAGNSASDGLSGNSGLGGSTGSTASSFKQQQQQLKYLQSQKDIGSTSGGRPKFAVPVILVDEFGRSVNSQQRKANQDKQYPSDFDIILQSQAYEGYMQPSYGQPSGYFMQNGFLYPYQSSPGTIHYDPRGFYYIMNGGYPYLVGTNSHQRLGYAGMTSYLIGQQPLTSSAAYTTPKYVYGGGNPVSIGRNFQNSKVYKASNGQNMQTEDGRKVIIYIEGM